MNRFVLIIPFAIPETQQLVNDYVRKRGWGFWHYGAETWLLTTSERIDAAKIRDTMNKMLPGVVCLVTMVELPSHEIAWAATGPVQWKEWLEKTWENKDQR